MLNLDEFSTENLIKIQKVLKIILDELELQGLNSISCNKIPLKRFGKEGFCYEEIKTILNKINFEEGRILEIWNEEIESILESIAKVAKAPSADLVDKVQKQLVLKSFIDELEVKLKKINREKEPKKYEAIIHLITSFLTAFEMSEAQLKNTLLLKLDWEKSGLEKLKSIKNSIDEKLSKKDKKTTEIGLKNAGIRPFFDKEKGLLKINDLPVKTQKFSNQYYLLEMIFRNDENINKDWQFSELAELTECFEEFNDKKLYNIANAIKHKITEETGIKDFFITTNQSIKINPKYLKES
ncbi:MAG: hypothetical protein PHD96_01305 [Candidatus Pacebacteria bacterium]|nr:hypothetical protein [Candidatus Paceibacterota bacterium]